MDDYHEFGRDYAVEIDAWKRHCTPNYLSITQDGVGTSGGLSISISGGASSSISEGTSGAIGAIGTSTSSGAVSIAGGSMRRDASGAIKYWYRILDRELDRRVRDATLMSDASLTLVHVFALSEKIELNMVEERVVTSSFARLTTTTSRIPHSPSQSRPMASGSGSRGVQTQHPSGHREPGARPPLPSFSGQPQGPSCWTCGGGHMRKDCPREREGQTSQARSQIAEVTCDHCHRPGHP
ncbi:hypothetical protein AXG93_4530s1300 [Marchantia polymorpha subsp. ruderalis]|uniref:CCHC-type domain-containing protein n=1 Tax=Marchantia polymorpha subsp. ruderalis TaxID=1480154 RepID=A0A176VUE8_MARPO|nr:hypothetical protein AXG93_4530s1300 [Marchantia polymorpha subsp. ruderalis]